MAGPIKCRECKHPVAGKAHVILPLGIRDGRAICVTCADKLTAKYASICVSGLVDCYMADHGPTSQITALVARVTELEALLSQLTEPEPRSRGFA